MNDLGKWLILIGSIIVVIGFVLWIGNRVGIPFGKMPGDINLSLKNFSFQFSLMTSLLVSILLTVLINLVIFLLKK